MTTTHDVSPAAVQTAGRLCVTGALLGAAVGLLAALVGPVVAQDRFSYPFSPAGHVLVQSALTVSHLMVLAGFLGVLRSDAFDGHRRGRLAMHVAAAGMGLLAACEIWAATFADAAASGAAVDILDAAYGIASIGVGAGSIVAGIAIVRAGRWQGWQAYALPVSGLVLLMAVIPAIAGPALLGRLALVAWVLLYVPLGLALIRSRTPELAFP
jgi:hypothetical protein